TEIGKLNLRIRRRNCCYGFQEKINRAVVEVAEISGLCVIPPSVWEVGICHRLQIKEWDGPSIHGVRATHGKRVLQIRASGILITRPDQRAASYWLAAKILW